MKVAWFHRFGGPEVLVYEDAPDPEPAVGEALVRVCAIGVNHVDLDIREGISRFPVTFPHILGYEVAGEVVAVNDSESSLKEGDRVWVIPWVGCRACEFCLTGRDHLCDRQVTRGRGLLGGYAEMVAAGTADIQPLPSHADFQDAAAAQIAFATTWHALLARAALKPGQSLIIHAAGSGVGSAGIQVARLAGATVFATASTDQKLARARELGAEHIINYTQEDFAARVTELTDGRGVDIVMDSVGGEVFTKSLECLKNDGALIIVGGHGGEVIPFDVIPIFRKELRIMGSRVSTRAELLTVMALVFDGKLKPVIHQALPLSQAAEAHRVVASRELFGKVLLLP